MSTPHVLVVDDEPDIRELIKEILEEESYSVTVAENAEAARAAQRDRRPDLALLDVWMPGVDGLTLLKEWRAGGELPFPVILISGHGNVETAVEATKLGAYDFIEKPIALVKLLLCVERALEANRLRRENTGLRQKLPAPELPLGSSEAMTQLREGIERIAQADAPVLLLGEAGVGKEHIARMLHRAGARRDSPFVALRSEPQSENGQLEELVGREIDGNIDYGKFDDAAGGTLFIEELASLSEESQKALANAMEGRQFIRCGGTAQTHLDARIIAASRRDLQSEMKKGRLDSELYYMLNVLPLEIPPLRQRVEDIPELVKFYAEHLPASEDVSYRPFSTAALNVLRHYPWPGNVRELRNLVQRLLILGSGEVSREEVEQTLGMLGRREQEGDRDLFEMPLKEARECFERDYLLHHLRSAGGSVSRLAKRVGMERTHLYRKLKALDIDPKEVDRG